MHDSADKEPNCLQGAVIITDDTFKTMVADRACDLLSLSDLLVTQPATSVVLTRPSMNHIFLQATQLEEFLDTYGARYNRRWARFRSLVATIKLFAEFGYQLLYIQHSLKIYPLLPIGRDCATSTRQTLEITCEALIRAAIWFKQKAIRLELPIPSTLTQPTMFGEVLPPGQLAHNRPRRKVKSAAETVKRLATAYLNLAVESDLLHQVTTIDPSKYAKYVPHPVSEDALRQIKVRFHTLQSLYDTHVSGTEVECMNQDLPTLRSHISLIYHFLETATLLAHYFERHVNTETSEAALRRKPVIEPQHLLETLMGYSITYAGLYLDTGRELCHTLLKLYAEVVQIEAPVPAYRGFHVRPSTLIARIARHYGCEVRMQLDGQSYDASSPMDIFRANETINAQKRRWLVLEIGNVPLPEGPLDNRQTRAVILDIVFKMAEQGKIVIYQQPFQLSEEFSDEGTLLEEVTSEIKRLQTTGQLDIKIDMNITLIGDKRVLDDLKLLADSGYGEDRFGNNIALPKQLSYLRR